MFTSLGSDYRRARRRRARRCSGRLRVGLPEGRPRQRRRRRLGVEGPRLRAHLDACLRRSTAIDEAERLSRSARATGCRCAGPWTGARSGRCCSWATRPGSSIRSPATGCTRRSSARRLAAESTLELCTAERRSRPLRAALDRELARAFAASWKARDALERFPQPDLRRRPPAARRGASSRPSCAATSRIR